MGFYVHRSPGWLQALNSSLLWSGNAAEPTLYLTFDDGPIPEVTPLVVDILDKYQAKATFFCVGDNITKHPREFNQLLEKGHLVANHTYNHMVGWDTECMTYLDNIEKCQQEIEKHTGAQGKKYFRPPHGKISRKQVSLLKADYELVMWTYLTGDFDWSLPKEKCAKRAVQRIRSNDIVVFHDSVKSYQNMVYALPRVLDHYSRLGYAFHTL